MSRLVVVLLMLPLAVTAGTCLDGTTSMIAGSNLVVEIVGPKATIYPPLSSGQPDRNAFSLGLDMTMITERRRGGLNGDPNQPTNDICFAPMNSFSDPSVTPLSDHWHGTQCGDLVKYVNLTEFDCSTREFTAYPLPGVQVKSVELTMAHESSPFTFVALFELPNANATKATYSNTTYSNGTVYSTHYREDVLKISWDLHGWDWNRTHENGTFVATYTQMTRTLNSSYYSIPLLDISQGYLSMRQDGRWTTMSWASPTGDKGVVFEIESAFVIDGVPYVRQAADSGNTVSENVYFDSRTILSYFNGARVCEKNMYWTNLSIDPFVGMFSVSPPSGKGTAAYVIVLPVVFGLVVLAAAIIVVAAIVSPTVRQFFRPFSKDRNDALRDGHLSLNEEMTSDQASGWTKSVKPGDK